MFVTNGGPTPPGLNKSTAVSAVLEAPSAVKSADPTQPVAVVNIGSPWLSKVNITNVVQVLAVVLVMVSKGKLNLDTEQQLQLVGGILVVGNILTVIFKTYFTKTVTVQSL